MPDLLKRRPFQLLLAGQGISNFGEACRLVAITLFLVRETGSGVSAAFGLICSALPGILLSPFAGAIGDLLPEKPLLAAADFVRALLVLSLLACHAVGFVYLLIVVLSITDILCNPARRKFIASIVGKRDLLGANSYLTGVSGAAYLVGPLAGGFLAGSYGSGCTFLLNSLTYLLSGISILFIRYRGIPSTERYQPRSFYNEMLAGFTYIRKQKTLQKTIGICAVLSFGMISMNMAFYPFVFDVLHLTAKGWSVLLSVYYGTNLAAMAAAPLISEMGGKNAFPVIFTGLAATAVIWGLYSFTRNLALVFLFQLLEGTIIAICGIILSTLLQSLADRRFIARVSGINDLTGSLVKLGSMLYAFVMLKYMSFSVIFICDALLLLLFSCFGFITLRHSRNQKFFL